MTSKNRSFGEFMSSYGFVSVLIFIFAAISFTILEFYFKSPVDILVSSLSISFVQAVSLYFPFTVLHPDIILSFLPLITANTGFIIAFLSDFIFPSRRIYAAIGALFMLLLVFRKWLSRFITIKFLFVAFAIVITVLAYNSVILFQAEYKPTEDMMVDVTAGIDEGGQAKEDAEGTATTETAITSTPVSVMQTTPAEIPDNTAAKATAIPSEPVTGKPVMTAAKKTEVTPEIQKVKDIEKKLIETRQNLKKVWSGENVTFSEGSIKDKPAGGGADRQTQNPPSGPARTSGLESATPKFDALLKSDDELKGGSGTRDIPDTETTKASVFSRYDRLGKEAMNVDGMGNVQIIAILLLVALLVGFLIATKAPLRSKRDPEIFFTNGSYLFENGNYNNALLEFNKAIDLNNKSPKYLFFKGQCYERLGQTDKAVFEYTSALSINPEYFPALNARGICYYKLHRMKEAIYDLSRVIKSSDDNFDAYYYRACIHYLDKDYNNALEDFKKVIEGNPKYASAYQNIGNIHYHKGQDDEAIYNYTKAIELSPRVAKTFYNRAQIYSKKGLFIEAVADFDRALELEPQYADAYFNKGDACYSLGMKEEALSAYQMYLEYAQDKNSPEANYAKAKISELRG